MTRTLAAVLAILALLASAPLAVRPLAAQPVAVPNASFEDGADGRPAAWTLSGGAGEWLSEGAAAGSRAVAVTGQGKDSNYWRSPALPMDPGGVYLLRFKARRTGTGGGTPVTGPAFANHDLGFVPDQWTDYRWVFAAPADLKRDQAFLRFGQWEITGTVAYDDVHLAPAMPVYAWKGVLGLGEGERLDGLRYVFVAPLGATCGNVSRPLAGHTSGFNSNRWTFGRGQSVTYRHQLGKRKQAAAKVSVDVCYHTAGELAVFASADGERWTEVGALGKVVGGTFDVPAAMLPADEVFIRLLARPAGGDAQGNVTLQVSGYSYEAAVDGDPAAHTGATRFFAVESKDPRFDVNIVDVGELVPGDFNVLTLHVFSRADKDVPAVLMARVTQPDATPVTSRDSECVLRPGGQLLQIRYFFAKAGPGTLRVSLGDAPAAPKVSQREEMSADGKRTLIVTTDEGLSGFVASADFNVPALYSPDFGARLPASTDAVGLWWASSGWKIAPRRARPADESDAAVLRAARGEAEAVQVVVRPEQPLAGLTAAAGALAGPDGATIPASAVEILKVRYVTVTHPTDASSCSGEWPDPLPPLAVPVDVAAGSNQPLWVRVTVPKDARAGVYRGSITLRAAGWQAEAPLAVEVYDFALPERMTCQSSFGFDLGNVWRYQGVKDEAQRREVFHKYMANFAAHRISPYHPDAMAPLKVRWPNGAAKGSKEPLPPERIVPAFDWTAWDAAMTRAVDEYKFNAFMVSVPGMGGGSFHHRVDPDLLGWTEDTPQYKAAFTAYGRALEAHLKEKGWLPYAYIYWFDEPDPKDYAFVTNGFRKLKEACPGITRMLTEQPEPELAGGPNLWCPVSESYDHARAEARRAAGDRFWWYVCCGPKAPYATLFIDHPATELRVWLWQTWQRKIEGILIWQTNYWTSDTAYPDAARPQNPYDDPMGWVSGYGTPTGARRPWGNGDGRFLYPPESCGNPSATPVTDGPVDSIRWEMLRDGVEDYEYLAVLKRLLAEKGAALPAEKRAALEALLVVPADITTDMTHFTTDPAPIEARRDAVARAIVELLRVK